jgi:Fe-Mn family superoxide dismutase
MLARRTFLKISAGMGALAMLHLAGLGGRGKATAAEAAIELPPLPYPENALEPYISARTIGFHYGKHHRGYVDKTNGFVAGTGWAEMDLITLVQKTGGKPEQTSIFNNAAQVFNHNFYWHSIKPGGGGEPGGSLGREIKVAFGSYQGFAAEFKDAAASQFGSGWAWLVRDAAGLKILKTANADTPITLGLTPLLTIDVWEHAYYLDYQNRRGDYIQAFLDHLVNWDFAAQNLG